MLLATPTKIVKGFMNGYAALDNFCFGCDFFRVSSGQVFCSYPKATFSPNLPNKNSCFFSRLVWAGAELPLDCQSKQYLHRGSPRAWKHACVVGAGGCGRNPASIQYNSFQNTGDLDTVLASMVASARLCLSEWKSHLGDIGNNITQHGGGALAWLYCARETLYGIRWVLRKQ